MRTLTAPLQTHIAQEVTSLVQCLEIVRNDGVILRMTEFNRNLIVDGQTFKTGATFNASAIKSSSDLSVDNVTMDIGIDGITLSKADFERDLLKRAKFRLFSVNWQSLSDGAIDLKRGWIGDVTLRDENWVTVSLRGLTQALQRNILEQYSPTCRAEFGDKRCSMAISPLQRHRQGKAYKTGDRVVVPDPSLINNVFFPNASFEQNGNVSEGSSGINNWEIPAGSRWSITSSTAGMNGTYSLQGGTITGAISSVSQYMSATVAGMSASLIDRGNYVLAVDVGLSTPSSTQADEARLTIITYNNTGTILQTVSSNWEKGTYNLWMDLSSTLLVRPGTRFFRVVMEGKKTSGAINVLFDNVRVFFYDTSLTAINGVVYKSVRIPGRVTEDRVFLPNFRFADNGLVTDNGSIASWSNVHFAIVNSAPGLTPYDGAFFALAGDNLTGLPAQEYSLTQTVNLPRLIPSGQYIFELNISRAHLDTTDTSRVKLVFQNAASVPVGTVETAYATLGATGVWETLRLSAGVPSTATRVVIYLYGRSGANSNCNVAFGGVYPYVFNASVAQKNDPTRGLSASVRPTFNTTVGTFTYDGDLIWQALSAPFGFDQVDDVTDRRVFNGLNIAGGEFAFYGAKITWLSGPNAGTDSFVRTWITATKTLKVYVPLTDNISIGDKFLFSLGCNKTISDCATRFNNAINFRGEPYLPGAEKALQFFANAG